MKNVEADKKILFVSEALSAPFDEGIKNVSFSLHKQLKEISNCITVTGAGNNTDQLEIVKVRLNKLFLNNELKKVIKKHAPDAIIYLPEASVTFNSFIRAKVLKLFSGCSNVVMVGVKKVSYSCFQRSLITNLLKPDLLLLLGKFDMEFFHKAGLQVKILPPAVDSERFCQATGEEKEKLLTEFNMPNNKTVVLHVGHIRSTRNIECFLEVQKIDDVQVVVVGSTSTVIEKDLKNKLESRGVRIIDKYIEDMSIIYNMADIYVFPVFDKIGCIEMPLSVLEAMACNLPVLTTRFGGLEDYFKEDDSLRYFDTVEELVELVKVMKDRKGTEIESNKKIEPFTWRKFTDKVISAFNELG